MKPILGALLVVFALSLAAAPQIPDVQLTDQNGHRVHFRGDLVKGKIVVVNFIFTSCTTVCSPMGANFAALQRQLGDRPGVALISVSIDPTTDTPAKLKSWSERFHARPGWTLVTGSRNDIERLLKSLGVYSPNRFTHAPIALVGSDASGRWERVSGLLAPEKFVSLIDGLRPRASNLEAATK
jgi:protein SCO1/2